jgi:hypothetical protein
VLRTNAEKEEDDRRGAGWKKTNAKQLRLSARLRR